MNTGLSALYSVTLQLNSSITELQEALSNLSSMCMGDSTCLSLVPPVPQTDLDFNENVRLRCLFIYTPACVIICSLVEYNNIIIVLYYHP